MSSKLIAKIAIAIFMIATVTITAYGAENETQQLNMEQDGNSTEGVEQNLNYAVFQQIIRPVNPDEVFYISNNRMLADIEMESNAKYIYYYLSSWGWSDNAIFALLGNAELESSINPGKWQNKGGPGYGLVQWTPGKKKIIAWANNQGLDSSSLYTQLLYLNESAQTGEGWIKSKAYPQSFAEFTQDTEHDVEWLAGSFFKNFERAKHNSIPTRAKNARKWEAYFKSL